jgi:hypothetical protein
MYMYRNIVGDINGNVKAATIKVLKIISNGESKSPDSEIQPNHKYAYNFLFLIYFQNEL